MIKKRRPKPPQPQYISLCSETDIIRITEHTEAFTLYVRKQHRLKLSERTHKNNFYTLF